VYIRRKESKKEGERKEKGKEKGKEIDFQNEVLSLQR